MDSFIMAETAEDHLLDISLHSEDEKTAYRWMTFVMTSTLKNT